jgi:hypothetical protein
VDNSGLYPINVGGKYGYMDRSGKTVIAPQFDKASGFSEGRAHIRVGSKSGYINTKGAIVINPQFDDAMQFQQGRAAVKLCCGLWQQTSGKDTFGFIDKDGKFISSPTFLWVGSFSEGFAPVKTANGTLAFVDRDGKVVPALSGKFEMLFSSGFVSGLAAVRSEGKFGFIGTDGKWVIDPQFEAVGTFADGLAAVRVGGKSGFIDRKGKFVINPQYDWCDDFYEGFALVKSSWAFSFIDTKGQAIGDGKYSAASHFSDGLAAVKTVEGWGFIDRTGKMVVSPQFDAADPFQDGLARVTAASKEAYITKAGAFAVDPFPGRAGIPAHPVQELWTGTPPDGLLTYRQRFILIREGTQIRGYTYYYFGRANHPLEIKGQTAQDGSFSMTDQIGTTWKGRFASSMLISGTQVNPQGSVKEFPVRLRLTRDATAGESEPPPATSSDWGVFLSTFKDTAQRRDFGALSRMMARNLTIGDRDFLSPDEARPLLRWDQLNSALSRGVEASSSTPWGSALRTILDEHPCLGCRYQVMLIFGQDGGGQWRMAGIGYPGD